MLTLGAMTAAVAASATTADDVTETTAPITRVASVVGADSDGVVAGPVPAGPAAAGPVDAGSEGDPGPLGDLGLIFNRPKPTQARQRQALPTATHTVSPPLRSITMAFTGDFLPHTKVYRTAGELAADTPGRDHDFRPYLEPIRPLVESADWAVCHMEVNLSADGTRLSSYPVFRAPGQLAFDAAEIGYDSCSLASNHILDKGIDGVAETISVFDDADLAYTGAARSAEEAESQIWLDVNGVKVAHLSYAYGFNGFQIPAEVPWTSNLIDETNILARAEQARSDGADFVILSLHWGEEYRHQPSAYQRDLGPRLLASPDVDLIVGHHAHVVQPVDRLDGEWLIYGLGNLLSGQGQLPRRDELLVEVTIDEQPDGSFAAGDLTVAPLYLDARTLTVHPSNPTTRPLDIEPGLAAELDASWSRVNAVLETGTGFDTLKLG